MRLIEVFMALVISILIFCSGVFCFETCVRCNLKIVSMEKERAKSVMEKVVDEKKMENQKKI